MIAPSITYKFAYVTLLMCLLNTSLALTEKEDNNITVAIGFSLEPYVFKNGNGIIAELIRESFKLSGKTTQFTLYSNVNAVEHFLLGQSDGVAVVTKGMIDAHLSKPFVIFQNYAISLKNKHLNIQTPADLKPYSIIAFSNARKLLGKEFSETIQEVKNYKEMEKQIDQVRALFLGQTDIIIADKTIFNFYLSRLRNRLPLNKKYRQPVVLHNLFAPSNYRAAFHEKQLRDKFDKGFEKLNTSGEVQNIYQFYSNLLKHY